MTVELLDHEYQPLIDISDKGNQRWLSRTKVVLDEHKSTLNYPHFSSNTIRQKLLDLQQVFPDDDPSWKHKVMTLSDLELASKHGLESVLLNETAVKGAIREVSGHEISIITNELLRAHLGQIDMSTLPLTYHPKQDEEGYVRYAIKNSLNKYQNIKLENITEIAFDAWKDIKAKYLFRYQSHNRKITESGSQFSPKWVHDYWTSQELKGFEETIFFINQDRIVNYLSNLFDEFAFLPIESNPDLDLTTEKPIISHVEFGDFRIQFNGRIDYAISDFLGIDTKFGSSDTLFSPVNRIQSLLYSHVLRTGTFSKSYLTDVTPKDTLFYYHWYDTKSSSPASYYIDGTVYPDEYVGVLDNLCQLAQEWVSNYDEFRRIKEIQSSAVVLPFLADPN